MTSGQQTIDQLGLGALSIGADAGILVAYIATCRLIAYLGIRFIKSVRVLPASGLCARCRGPLPCCPRQAGIT